MASGKFITFEGGEGAGKSTQARLLAQRLSCQGIEVLVTREPGGSAFAEHVRTLLLDPRTPSHSALAEALLFYAARADHLEKTIRPALAAGHWVICDRFSDSTHAYQGAAGGVEAEVLEAFDHMVVGFSRPDLTVILDLEPREGLARARGRPANVQYESGADRFEARHLTFHERLRAGYLAIAAANPERCTVVEASLPPEEIATVVWQAVEQRLLAGTG